jgi:hypothetical protein
MRCVWSEPLATTTMQIQDDSLVAAGAKAIAGAGPAKSITRGFEDATNFQELTRGRLR